MSAVYHWLEVNFRLRLMGLGKAQSVEKLSDEMAIELGAEMLGEFIIFTVAAGTLLLEYQRSAKKEAIKEEREKHQVLMLKQKLQVRSEVLSMDRWVNWCIKCKESIWERECMFEWKILRNLYVDCTSLAQFWSMLIK